MSDDDIILEAARSIRSYLHQLIPESADAVDLELAEHLEEAPTEKKNVNSLIIGTLRMHEPTREWLLSFLADHQPPEVTRAFTYQGTPGDPVPVAARKYICPQGDYNWYRMSAGTPIPSCPTHGLALVPSP
jgi:hypothetical protein